MNQIKEDLEARLFCLTHLGEYYLHQMLTTNDPLRQDTLLVIISIFRMESSVIQESLLRFEINSGYSMTILKETRQLISYTSN